MMLRPDLKSEFVDRDEREMLIREHPLALKLPVNLCLRLVSHLRDSLHHLPSDGEHFAVW
jgi:hypothetical protein